VGLFSIGLKTWQFFRKVFGKWGKRNDWLGWFEIFFIQKIKEIRKEDHRFFKYFFKSL
jgi:hypothetical protein